MGAGESNPIRNMDKRTARREYKADFCRAIQHYRNVVCKDRPKDELTWTEGEIMVFVRKRPIFKHELDLDEFDVVTCVNGSMITIHDARMHTDMKRQFMNHHEFSFDRVFDETIDNLNVYSETTAPLVQIAVEGGFSTCLVYGQTGSGKTFTMGSIYEQAAFEIFVRLEASTARLEATPKVSLSFFEIAGDLCFDLFNGFAEAQLLAGNDGNFHAFPVVEPSVSSPEEMIALINFGRSVRTTAATGVHDASSRSHAVLRIYIHKPVAVAQQSGNPNPYAVYPSAFAEGTLTLVDLAGSEHRIDSMYHTAERRKEGANINASLMALKECIRARASKKNFGFHYRKSRLTMALKQSFSASDARTVVIATVSPASKDTEHSLNTIRHACVMGGQDVTEDGRETRFMTGGQVHTVQVGEINVSQISKRNMAAVKAGDGVSSMKSSNGNTVEGVKRQADRELTDKEKARIRRISVKRSLAALSAEHRKLLEIGKSQLRNDPRQKYRLQRASSEAIAAAAADAETEALAQQTAAELAKQQSTSPAAGKQARGKGPSRTGSQQDFENEEEDDADYDDCQAGVDEFLEGGGRESSNRQGAGEENDEGDEADDCMGNLRIGYQQLYETVYRPSNKASESVRRRQLMTLMKMNGYNDEEIRGLAPPSPTDKYLQKMKSRDTFRTESVENGSGKVSSGDRGVRLDFGREPKFGGAEEAVDDSAGSTSGRRRGTGSSGADGNEARRRSAAARESSEGLERQQSYMRYLGDSGISPKGALSDRGEGSLVGLPSLGANEKATRAKAEVSAMSAAASRQEQLAAAAQALEQEAATRKNRQAQARENRIRAEEGKREALRAKLNLPLKPVIDQQQQEQQGERSARVDREAEISRLEDMLMTGEGLSAAAIFALNKQIATHRAALLREQREQRDRSMFGGESDSQPVQTPRQQEGIVNDDGPPLLARGRMGDANRSEVADSASSMKGPRAADPGQVQRARGSPNGSARQTGASPRLSAGSGYKGLVASASSPSFVESGGGLDGGDTTVNRAQRRVPGVEAAGAHGEVSSIPQGGKAAGTRAKVTQKPRRQKAEWQPLISEDEMQAGGRDSYSTENMHMHSAGNGTSSQDVGGDDTTIQGIPQNMRPAQGGQLDYDDGLSNDYSPRRLSDIPVAQMPPQVQPLRQLVMPAQSTRLESRSAGSPGFSLSAGSSYQMQQRGAGRPAPQAQLLQHQQQQQQQQQPQQYMYHEVGSAAAAGAHSLPASPARLYQSQRQRQQPAELTVAAEPPQQRRYEYTELDYQKFPVATQPVGQVDGYQQASSAADQDRRRRPAVEQQQEWYDQGPSGNVGLNGNQGRASAGLGEELWSPPPQQQQQQQHMYQPQQEQPPYQVGQRQHAIQQPSRQQLQQYPPQDQRASEYQQYSSQTQWQQPQQEQQWGNEYHNQQWGSQQQQQQAAVQVTPQPAVRHAAYSGRAAMVGFVAAEAAAAPPLPRGGRRGAAPVGAASAPFANDFSWQNAGSN